MQLFSGSTNCRLTCVFHIASNFLLKVKVNTSYFVHPSVGMQVNAKCMIWHKCGDLENIQLFFPLHTRAGDTGKWWFKLNTLMFIWVSPLCVYTSLSSIRLTKCVSSGPAGVTNLTCPFSLSSSHQVFFLFAPLFCCTLLISQGI